MMGLVEIEGSYETPTGPTFTFLDCCSSFEQRPLPFSQLIVTQILSTGNNHTS
jgi:hypothetical protein